MLKDTPLDSSGFKNVDGDVEMIIAPEAYPVEIRTGRVQTDDKYKLLILLI